MLQLLRFPEPYWLDLPDGVRVKVRPLSAAVLGAAEASARRQLAGLFAEHQERIATSAPTDDLPDVFDDDTRRGLLASYLAAGLARHGIVAWEGIGAGDEAAPVTPENVALFAAMPIGLRFLEAYETAVAGITAEGNASATTPHGSSDVVATTAAVAPETAPPALAG